MGLAMPGEVFIQTLRSTLSGWLKSLLLLCGLLAGLLGWHAAGVPLPVQQVFARLSGASLPLSGWEAWLFAAGFNLLFGLVLCGCAILTGSRLMAGAEERGALALILAFPIPRWQIVVEKALGLAAGVLLVCTALRLLAAAPGLFSPRYALNADALSLAAFTLALPPILLGSLALALASAGGRLGFARWVSLAVWGVWGGLAVLSRAVSALGFLTPVTGLYMASPNGAHPSVLMLLLGTAALLAVMWSAAASGFEQRDLSD